MKKNFDAQGISSSLPAAFAVLWTFLCSVQFCLKQSCFKKVKEIFTLMPFQSDTTVTWILSKNEAYLYM